MHVAVRQDDRRPEDLVLRDLARRRLDSPTGDRRRHLTLPALPLPLLEPLAVAPGLQRSDDCRPMPLQAPGTGIRTVDDALGDGEGLHRSAPGQMATTPPLLVVRRDREVRAGLAAMHRMLSLNLPGPADGRVQWHQEVRHPQVERVRDSDASRRPGSLRDCDRPFRWGAGVDDQDLQLRPGDLQERGIVHDLVATAGRMSAPGPHAERLVPAPAQVSQVCPGLRVTKDELLRRRVGAPEIEV